LKELELSQVDIIDLLNFLKQNYSDVFYRVWREGTKTLAVFIHEQYVRRTHGDQTTTVLVEHDGQNGHCRLTVVASGARSGLLQLDWGSQNAAESAFLSAMDRYQKGLNSVRIRCSICGATYIYEPYLLRSGKAICQNCGHSLTKAGAEAAW
jgi:hypothetical protein